MNKPEILLPAKDLETLKIACMYGADAVYMGGKAFGLRKNATNFTLEEMKEAIDFAHEHGKKVYITANIIAKNEDIKSAGEYFSELKQLGPDGVLVADPGMYSVLKRQWPDAPIHISTQAGNSNYETVLFWYNLGITRVVLERLLTLDEIKEMKEHLPEDSELEAFVHGAMCISYSGRCLLSAALTGKDANKGECTHPCRWQYSLVESKREGEYFPIEEDEGGTYIMNSKDLCMIDKIPELVDAGINSLKIEGRMKNILYVATMARAYRRAVDSFFESREKYESILPELVKEVGMTTHRPYSHGFYFGDTGSDGIVYEANSYMVESTYLGYVHEVRDDGYIKIIQKNKFCVGDNIEVMSVNGDNKSVKVLDMTDEKGNFQESCPHSKQVIYVKLSEVPSKYEILTAPMEV